MRCVALPRHSCSMQCGDGCPILNPHAYPHIVNTGTRLYHITAQRNETAKFHDSAAASNPSLDDASVGARTSLAALNHNFTRQKKRSNAPAAHHGTRQWRRRLPRPIRSERGCDVRARVLVIRACTRARACLRVHACVFACMRGVAPSGV